MDGGMDSMKAQATVRLFRGPQPRGSKSQEAIHTIRYRDLTCPVSTSQPKRDSCARKDSFTLIELVVVLSVLVLIVALLLPGSRSVNTKARNITCVSRLKRTALAFRIFATDHTNQFPMRIGTNLGGSREYVGSRETFRHFQVMSNELSTPLPLHCPGDKRVVATNFSGSFANFNVSYFVGLEADETDPQMLLAGDRDVTNDAPQGSWILHLRTNSPAGWRKQLHQYGGNAALADGSVGMFSDQRLREQLRCSASGTNRISLPE